MKISGRVVANFGATVAVCLDQTEDTVQAHPLNNLPLLVAGDRVQCEQDLDSFRVTELVPRRTVLERVEGRNLKALAANLTHLGIVAADPPGMDTLLIDQFCLAAYQADLQALIVINKADRIVPEHRARYERLLLTYQQAGHLAVLVDTKSPTGLDPLRAELANRAIALVGASGVGKSSIIQALLPDRDVRIGAISAATGLGAHTTSVTFWYQLGNNAVIVDSPGVRQYSVSHLSEAVIRQGYFDIAGASADCRFTDCSHTVEPDCAVIDAVASGRIARWRYRNYRKLLGALLVQY